MSFLVVFLLGCRPDGPLIVRGGPSETTPKDISTFDSGEVEDTAG